MTKKEQSVKVINEHGPLGFVFFVAFIGAWIYFIQKADGFWELIGAFFQAIVWPGFVVYHALRLLGA